jgi:hypothetical protein
MAITDVRELLFSTFLSEAVDQILLAITFSLEPRPLTLLQEHGNAMHVPQGNV